MKDGTKNIIAACILAMGLIIASLVYAYSTRYGAVVVPDNGIFKIDRLNGTIGRFTRPIKQ